ncbi:MAG: four helix bundle protein [Candidatus Latescibacterota bacterium]
MPVWKEAMDLAEEIFLCTEKLPRKEGCVFASRIERSALSISAHIAEDSGRQHSLDKRKFYYYARGSITETQSHLEYGKRVGYLSSELADGLDGQLSQIHRDLNRVISALKPSP